MKRRPACIFRKKEYVSRKETSGAVRKKKNAGYPEESVGTGKQKKICGVADYYLYQRRLGESIPVRFDVVAICGECVNWYQNAFDYIRRY